MSGHSPQLCNVGAVDRVQLHGHNLGSLPVTVIHLHPVVCFSFFFIDILGFLFFVCITCWDHMARGGAHGGRRRTSGSERTRPYTWSHGQPSCWGAQSVPSPPPTITTPSAQDSQLQVVRHLRHRRFSCQQT